MNPREHADCSCRNDDECDEDGKQAFPCYVFPHPDADHGRCGQSMKAGKSSGKSLSGQSSVLLSIF